LKLWSEGTEKFDTIEGGASVSADVNTAGAVFAVRADGQLVIGMAAPGVGYYFKEAEGAIVGGVAVAEDGTLALINPLTHTLAFLSADFQNVIVDVSGQTATQVHFGAKVAAVIDINGNISTITDNTE